MTKYQFRWLVALSLVIGLLAGALDFIVPSLIPEAVRAADQEYWAQPFSTFDYITSTGLFLTTILMLVAIYGLLFFKKWGPSLAVTSTLLGVLATAVAQFVVFSGAALALIDLAAYAWGAALIVCHLEPYKAWFRGEST